MQTKSYSVIYKIILTLTFLIFLIIFINIVSNKKVVDIDKNFVNKKEFTVDWKYKFDGDISSSVLVNNDKLYCLTMKSVLYEVNLKNFKVKKLIKYSDEEKYAELAFNNENLLAISMGKNIKVFDIKSNSIINEIDTDKILDHFTINNTKVFYSERGSINVQARNLNTLDLIWEYNPHIDHTSTNIIADNKQVYITGGKGDLVILDAEDGKVINKFNNDVGEPFILENEYLYMGYFKKIDKTNGEILWEINSNKISDVNKDEKYLYYYDKKIRELICLDKFTGKKKWDTYFGDVFINDIEIAGNYIVVLREDGVAMIINKKDGEKIWKYNSLRREFFTQPMMIYKNNLLFFSKNTLLKFDLNQ